MLSRILIRIYYILPLFLLSLFTEAQEIQEEVLSFEEISDTISVDSLISPVGEPRDSIFIAHADSVSVDPKEKNGEASESAIKSTITYQAADSIVVSLDGRRVYLYRSAQVNYEDIELLADYIELDMDSKEVYAEGLLDSLGVVSGTPVFTQGSDKFECTTLRYNFESQKGIIENIKTEEGEGFIHGERAKKIEGDSFILKNGKYTTCNADHPHFYLRLTKAKAVSSKKFVTGPAYMVLEDVPLYPLLLPFGFFPRTSSYSSGIIIPSYGEENSRGFFLRGGGYYWAASEFFDLKTTVDIYSKGSWAGYVSSRYRRRYMYNGNFSLSYNINNYGEKGLPDFYRTKGFSVRWSHSQDSKANPSQTFSASVDLSTSSYDKENSYDVNDYLSSQKSSSISYSKKFENSPLSMSANMRHSQNSRDSTITLGFPEMTLTMSRVYPFRRKEVVGKLQFWEKIAVGYTGNVKNSITAKESELLDKNLIKDWSNGVKHSIPITLPSFNLMKFINMSPSFSYNERWYSSQQESHYLLDPITGQGKLMKDTIYGFSRNYDYSMSLSATTTIYGMFMMTNPNWKMKAIRHKITPSVSASWRPDFGKDRFGFYDSYIDKNGKEQYFNRFDGAVYGSAGRGESGSISFSLTNLVEAKVLNTTNERDTVSASDSDKKEMYKKLSLLDNLGFSGSYNLVADSMNLSTIAIRGRTTIKGVSINFGGTLDPYAVDSVTGGRYNEFMWNQANGFSKLGRLTNANLSFGFSFKSKDNSKKKELESEAENEDKGDGRGLDGIETYVPDVENDPMANGLATGVDKFGNPIIFPGLNAPKYYDFNVPWSVNMNYSFNYTKTNPYKESTINQSMNLSGNMSLTANWKISMTTNYDIQAREFSFTTLNLTRSMHCWNMSFSFVPFGDRKSYSFTLAASSSMLRDLKVEKSKSWFDN
ncbi:MAG: putative LPS assembly protein LptD [Mangrovibacterium sp.]